MNDAQGINTFFLKLHCQQANLSPIPIQRFTNAFK